jgi:hypothetical protein
MLEIWYLATGHASIIYICAIMMSVRACQIVQSHASFLAPRPETLSAGASDHQKIGIQRPEQSKLHCNFKSLLSEMHH